MRFFITGGTGFIGGHLVHELIKEGHELWLLSRRGSLPTYPPLSPSAPIHPLRGDLLEPESYEGIISSVDGIFHLAGFISTRKRDRERIYRENFQATQTLWKVLGKVGFQGKVVYLASIFALGGGEERPVDENAEYRLNDSPVDYFRAKRLAEEETQKLITSGKLFVTFVYPTFCLGPGDLRLSSSRLLWMYLNMPIPVGFSGGWNILDVRDAARGILLSYKYGKLGEKTLLAGKNLSFPETFAILHRLTGLGQPRIYLGGKRLHLLGKLLEALRVGMVDEASLWISSRFWYYSGKKAMDQWGFRVRPVEETLRDAIKFFLDRGMVRHTRRYRILRARFTESDPHSIQPKG